MDVHDVGGTRALVEVLMKQAEATVELIRLRIAAANAPIEPPPA